MTSLIQRCKFAVAAGAMFVMLAGAVAAEDDPLDPLFEALRDAEGPAVAQIEQKIWEEWARSGSPSMDFLYERGRMALEAGDTRAAIGHFSALIDHAPDFAEAYNARATAYFQAGMYGPSIADIREVLARNPRHFGALSGLALILEDIGQKEGALEAYREVEKIHPNREGLKEAISRLEREVGGIDI